MFFRRDDLVHVGSKSCVQLNSLDLTDVHHGAILGAGLGQHLLVDSI